MTAITHIDGIPLKGRRWRVRLKGGGFIAADKPWAHAAECSCLPEHTFTCARCGRRVGWCLGCDDNMADACDFCWRAPADHGGAP